MSTNSNSAIVAQVYELAGLWIDVIVDASQRGATESARIGCQMVRAELSVLQSEMEPDQPGYQGAADAIMRLYQMIADIEDNL